MQDRVLYGSPHSLPTYKVALMLRLANVPFSFRYVSFQRGMHKKPEFLALSRWGQVPVLIESGRSFVQSTAIVELLSERFKYFAGKSADEAQRIAEWLWWEADALFPSIFYCYGGALAEKKLLKVDIDPIVLHYYRRRAESALRTIDLHLADSRFLCSAEPTIVDIICIADIMFADLCSIPFDQLPHVTAWVDEMSRLRGFSRPLDLLPMSDAEFS